MSGMNYQGFIGITSAGSYTPSTPVYTDDSLITAGVKVGFDENGDDVQFNVGGCNISFGTFANIDLNLPKIGFFADSGEPNLTLFKKADQFSSEIAMINDILIDAIQAMQCCDIAEKYNATVVPFFRYFADHPDTGMPNTGNNNFISILIDVVALITKINSSIEPIMCLIRPLPGNPWLPFDTDFLSWAYAYGRKAQPYIDKVMSGEIIDIMLNPVQNFRRKLEVCVSKAPGDQFFEMHQVGTLDQIRKLLNTAKKEGSKVVASAVPRPVKPGIPKPEHYTDNSAYQDAFELYNVKAKKYNADLITYNKIQNEIKETQVPKQAVDRFAETSVSTTDLVKASNLGLCGCVMAALGLEKIMPTFIDVHSSTDISNLYGKTLNITYGDVNISDRVHEKDDKLVFVEAYTKTDKLQKILELVEKDRGYYETDVQPKEESVENPYAKQIGTEAGKENITFNSWSVQKNKKSGNGWIVYSENEKIKKKIIELKAKKAEIISKAQSKETQDVKDYEAKKSVANDAMKKSSDAIDEKTKANPNADVSYDIEKYNSSQIIYNNYFTGWLNFDLNRDKSDFRPRSSFTDLKDMPGTYFGKSISGTVGSGTGTGTNAGDAAATVEVDPRSGTLFFDNGIIQQDGTVNWRANNPMGLEYNEYTKANGAIGYLPEDPYIAIYPDIEIGLVETMSSIRLNSNQSTLFDFLSGPQIKPLNSNIDTFWNSILYELDSSGNLKKTTKIESLSEDYLIKMIKSIAVYGNKFNVGKIWLDGVSKPAVAFIKPDTGVVAEIDDNAVSNTPQFIQSQINDQLKSRGSTYATVYGSQKEIESIDNLIQELQDTINSNIAARVLYLTELKIPCTCDDFICNLIQSVVSYILSLFNELLKELTGMLLKYMIPDSIRNLVRLVLEKAACVYQFYTLDDKFKIIEDAAQQLLEDLRERVELYPSNTCFLPDAITGLPEIGPKNNNTPPQFPWNSFDNTSGGSSSLNDMNNSLDPNNEYQGSLNPSTGGDSTGWGNSNTLRVNTGIPTFVTPNSSENYNFGLSTSLILTPGVKVYGIKAGSNIPVLGFDCGIEENYNRFTACNQSLDNNFVALLPVPSKDTP